MIVSYTDLWNIYIKYIQENYKKLSKSYTE